MLRPEVTLEQATATRASNAISANDQRGEKSPPVASSSDSVNDCDVNELISDQDYRLWTTREDRLLRELVAFRVPWSRISISLGNRPIEDVKERWDYLRSGKPQTVDVGVDGSVSTDGTTVGKPHLKKYARATQPEPKPERHVSFADPLVTARDVSELSLHRSGPHCSRQKKTDGSISGRRMMTTKKKRTAPPGHRRPRKCTMSTRNFHWRT